MNEGVKILLERMKTNPEEFVGEAYASSKWGGLIMQYRDYLNEEDKKALTEALNELTQQRFTEAVMKELLAPEDDSLGKPWYTTRTQGTGLAGATLGGSSVTLNSTNTIHNGGTWGTSSISLAEAQHQEQVKHMEAHLKALQKEKKHQTLFGKLFNYS